MRSQLERKLRDAIESTLDSFPEKHDIAWSDVKSILDEKVESPKGAL